MSDNIRGVWMDPGSFQAMSSFTNMTRINYKTSTSSRVNKMVVSVVHYTEYKKNSFYTTALKQTYKNKQHSQHKNTNNNHWQLKCGSNKFINFQILIN